MINIIYGTDRYRINEALLKAIIDVKKSFGLAIDSPVFRIHPGDKDAEQLFSRLEAPGLFQDAILAVIEDLGGFPKTFRDTLHAYDKKSSLSGNKRIAMLITVHIDGGSKKTRDAGDAIVKAFSNNVIKFTRFDALMGGAIPQWVITMAKQRGILMTKEIAEMYASALRDDTGLIAMEIEKLALFLGSGMGNEISVTTADLALLTHVNISQEAFKLIDAIGARNHKEAFAILLRLFVMEEDPIKITGLLAYALRAMLSVKDLETRPINPKDALQITNLQDWQIRQYRQSGARFTLEELKKFYERLLNIDYKTKTGECDPRLLLEKLLLTI